MENQSFNSNQIQPAGGDQSNSSVISHVGPSKKTRTISVDSRIGTKDLYEFQLVNDDNDSLFSVQSNNSSPVIKTNNISRQINSNDILNMDIVFQDQSSIDTNVPIESPCQTIGKLEPIHQDQTAQLEGNEMIIYDSTVQYDMEEIEQKAEAYIVDDPRTSNIKNDPSSDLNTIETIEIQTSQPVVDEQQVNSEEIEEEIYYDGGDDYHDEYINDPSYEIETIEEKNITGDAMETNDIEDPTAESVNYEAADYDDDEDGEDLKSLRDSLVVVATQDPFDANKITHEVYLISPSTGELSEEPLDLPPDVIERIVATLTLKS